MTSAGARVQQIEQVSSLDDATRRALYDFVAAQDEPVSRDHAASAVGLDRSVVAYHLDRLVDLGLLAATYARPEGRGGPGAGRPAKHYARTATEVAVSLPPRDYRLAAELLARAAHADATGAVRRALDDAAAEVGHELATSSSGAGAEGDAPVRGLIELLETLGFEPYEDGDTVRLRNCPFHALAQQHTDLVCGMNASLLGAAAAAVDQAYVARLDPAPDRCCVAFDPASDSCSSSSG